MATTMMSNGKAFEYATTLAFFEALNANGKEVRIDVSDAFNTAKGSFENLSDLEQHEYMAAARTAFHVISPLEPNLEDPGFDGSLVLKIQTDAKGQSGDVRDVVCIRKENGWELGISCKHNHKALKHPRVTLSSDFGTEWGLGIPCSKEFLREIEAIMEPVKKWEAERTLWCDHEEKHDLIYLPIVRAFAKELRRVCDASADAPARLMSYFFGIQDFYKVIAHDNRARGNAGMTEVMAFNISGTLGQASNQRRPLHTVRRLRLPNRLIEIGVKRSSKTTLIMTFDEGWVVTMRLHNADKAVKVTGLKWDIQLEGMPTSMHRQELPWNVYL